MKIKIISQQYSKLLLKTLFKNSKMKINKRVIKKTKYFIFIILNYSKCRSLYRISPQLSKLDNYYELDFIKLEKIAYNKLDLLNYKEEYLLIYYNIKNNNICLFITI